MAHGASSSATQAVPDVAENLAPTGDVHDGRAGSLAELPMEALSISVLPSNVGPSVLVLATPAIAVEVEVSNPRKKKAKKEPVPEEVDKRAAESVSGESVPAKKAVSHTDEGKKTGERSVTDVELRRLELEVARKRSEMISKPIVEQVDRSPLNLYECMKVHSLLMVHLAACARQRASKTHRVLQDLTAQGESLISAAREEAQRSVAAAEEKVQAAVAEKLSLKLDFNDKLAEAKSVMKSLEDSKNSLDAENRKLKEEHRFTNDSRDRISMSLVDTNARIDSLYTYDRAVQEYQSYDAFIRELDTANAEILEELHADYSAGILRMFPGADLKQFLEIVREEFEEAVKRREQRAKEL